MKPLGVLILILSLFVVACGGSVTKDTAKSTTEDTTIEIIAENQEITTVYAQIYFNFADAYLSYAKTYALLENSKVSITNLEVSLAYLGTVETYLNETHDLVTINSVQEIKILLEDILKQYKSSEDSDVFLNSVNKLTNSELFSSLRSWAQTKNAN